MASASLTTLPFQISDFRMNRDTDLSNNIEIDDTHPAMYVPQPIWKPSVQQTYVIADPALSLTPDIKLAAGGQKGGLRFQPETKKHLSKVKQKVRFDVDIGDDNTDDSETVSRSSVKALSDSNKRQTLQYSTSRYSDNIADERLTSNHDDSDIITVGSLSDSSCMDDNPVSVSPTEFNQSIPKIYHYHVDYKDSYEDADKDSRTSNLKKGEISYLTDILSQPKTVVNPGQPGLPASCNDSNSTIESNPCVVKEVLGYPLTGGYSFPFSANTSDLADENYIVSNALAKPEYNSTLRFCQKIQALRESQPAVLKAVQKQLNKSEQKKTAINEKAASKVNAKSDLYGGELVSVDVPTHDVVAMATRQRAAQPKAQYNEFQAKRPTAKEPDLLEFFSSDLQKEKPDFKLLGYIPPTNKLTTVSPYVAFDLYRHNRVWEGLR